MKSRRVRDLRGAQGHVAVVAYDGAELVGMRERATALGGDFAAGPTPEGWRVSCQLPLEGAR